MPRKPSENPAKRHNKMRLMWIRACINANAPAIRECSSYRVVYTAGKDDTVLVVEVWEVNALLAGCKEPVERWKLLKGGAALYESIRPSILISDGRPSLSEAVRTSLPDRIRALRSRQRTLTSYEATHAEIKRWYRQLFKHARMVAEKQPI